MDTLPGLYQYCIFMFTFARLLSCSFWTTFELLILVDFGVATWNDFGLASSCFNINENRVATWKFGFEASYMANPLGRIHHAVSTI